MKMYKHLDNLWMDSNFNTGKTRQHHSWNKQHHPNTHINNTTEGLSNIEAKKEQTNTHYKTNSKRARVPKIVSNSSLWIAPVLKSGDRNTEKENSPTTSCV